MAALMVGGASADPSPAMAATADDLVIGEEACSSRWDANCDGDTMDEVLFWLALWIWRAYKLYAGGGALRGQQLACRHLGGLGGDGGVAVPPIMRNLEEEEDDVELAVISPRSPVAAAAAVEQHPLPLPQ
ncbi:unnamed protein product [Ectocarpus sp. CCAP 1310/34]|nr:unnamed protein product [Ectocarpus sp. CCAP 1310/34]